MENDGKDILHPDISTIANAIQWRIRAKVLVKGSYALVLSDGSPATRGVFMRETEGASFDDSPTADFDRFAFSDVGKESQLSGAVNLD